MIDHAMLRWCIGAGLVLCTGCFDGRDALGLSCEQDFQCGNGQVCAEGSCAWPGDATGASSGAGETSTDPLDGCGMQVPISGDPIARDIFIDDSANAMAVVVGDFSGSGQAEIAVLTREPGQVSLFAFNGSTFQAPAPSVLVESEPMDLAAGDLDGDGLDDLAIVDANGTGAGLTLLWGAEDTPLQARNDSTADVGIAFSVAIGNLTGEGNQVVVSSGAQTVAAFLFAVVDRVPMRTSQYSGVSDSPWDTVVADLDGEAPSEILVAGANDAGLDGIEGSDEVLVLSASGGGLSRRESLTGIRSPYGVDAGDLDGDGVPELVVVGKNIDIQTATPEESSNPSQLARCSQDPGGGYSCEVWSAGENVRGFSNVRLADLNCDGHLDVVVGTSGNAGEDLDGAMFYAVGPLEPQFELSPLAVSGAIGNRIAIADVTNDGRPDILVPLFGTMGATPGTVRVYSFEEPTE